MLKTGSVTPNGVELRNSCTVCQLLCTASPAMKPITTGMPMPKNRSRWMITVRYRAMGSSGPLTGTNTGRER